MNRKNNKHYQKTHEDLQKTLVELAEKHDYVTVKMLCDSVGINRSTFYLHYLSFADLLNETYRNSFNSLDGIYKSFDHPVEPLSYESFLIICRHAQQNKGFYRLFLRAQDTFPISEGFEYLWDTTFVPIYQRMHVPYEQMHFRFVCVQAGFSHTLRSWLEKDCPVPAEDIARIMHECLHL